VTAATPRPAPLQIAAPGTPLLAAGHDPIGIVGIDLAVTQVEARLTAKGVGDHLPPRQRLAMTQPQGMCESNALGLQRPLGGGSGEWPNQAAPRR